MNPRDQALLALQTPEPEEKCQAVHAIWAQAQDWQITGTGTGHDAQSEPSTTTPGRPPEPQLVDPANVKKRSVHTLEGRAALLHAICHIEFNAINLALDAVWRFSGMPAPYYHDWVRVAHEEAQHFTLLHHTLQSMGHRYGDFDAHDGLWQMCEKTRHDIVARMALVPRTLEARGLDATPLIQTRLRKVNSPDANRICENLDIILRDEIGHVHIGNHWYGLLCQQRGLDPIAHYKQLAQQHQAPRLKPPFNQAARAAAGFSALELAYLVDRALEE
jgi:uncharacterized ferritin-like protein (DUF455 family)